jgi:hypothetical protein
LLEKWTDRGIYDYGVSLDLGWFYKADVEELLAGELSPGAVGEN